MSISEQEFRAANARAAARRSRSPWVSSVRFDRRAGRLLVELDSGLVLAFDPRLAPGLEHATPADLKVIEVSPSGLGIHVPALDADLFLPSLLEGFLGSRRWMAASMGRTGGSRVSEAKAAAARANGRLGGRPRKTPAPAGA